MTEDRTRAPGPDDDAFGAWDDALCRLEDVLLSMPYDDVLPDLVDLLDQARVPLVLLEHDDRARKLLGEAMLARPIADGDVVRRARVRVELLTLEVEVLAQRLRDPATSEDDIVRCVERIMQIQQQLHRLHARD